MIILRSLRRASMNTRPAAGISAALRSYLLRQNRAKTALLLDIVLSLRLACFTVPELVQYRPDTNPDLLRSALKEAANCFTTALRGTSGRPLTVYSLRSIDDLTGLFGIAVTGPGLPDSAFVNVTEYRKAVYAGIFKKAGKLQISRAALAYRVGVCAKTTRRYDALLAGCLEVTAVIHRITLLPARAARFVANAKVMGCWLEVGLKRFPVGAGLKLLRDGMVPVLCIQRANIYQWIGGES